MAAEGFVRALSANAKPEKAEEVAVSLSPQVQILRSGPQCFVRWSAYKCTSLNENVPGFKLLAPCRADQVV